MITPTRRPGINWNEDHVYGVLVTPTQLVFYIDDHETHRENNAGRFTMPLYMTVSLGVGPDSWNKMRRAPGFRAARWSSAMSGPMLCP